MANKVYYLGAGKYLEGEEAIKYVKQLEKIHRELYNETKKQLENALAEMDKYEFLEGEDYQTKYENVMNSGELLSIVSVYYLEPLVSKLEKF